MNIKYVVQKKFKNCINKETGYKLSFDFYLPDYNLCIEYDGEHHFRPIKYFGGEMSFKKIKIKDEIKTKFCKDNNIKLLRIKYTADVEQKLTKEILNVFS